LKKKSSGRPAASNNVCIVPEPNNKPDIEKLGRAFIAVAMKSKASRKVAFGPKQRTRSITEHKTAA